MKIYDENGLIDSDVQEVLYELGNVGLGMASVAIGKLMGLRLNIGVPKVMTAEQLLEDECDAEERIGILLDFERDMGGSMIFLLKEEFVDEVIEKTIQSEHMENEVLDEGERESVLQEFANITTAAYLKAISGYTGLRIYVRPVWMKRADKKRLRQDVFDRVKENCSSAICVDTGYTVVYENGSTMEDVGRVIMLPDIETVEKMIGPLMDEMQD